MHDKKLLQNKTKKLKSVNKNNDSASLDAQKLAEVLTDMFQNMIEDTINTEITSKETSFPCIELNSVRLINESHNILRNYISKKFKGE